MYFTNSIHIAYAGICYLYFFYCSSSTYFSSYSFPQSSSKTWFTSWGSNKLNISLFLTLSIKRSLTHTAEKRFKHLFSITPLNALICKNFIMSGWWTSRYIAALPFLTFYYVTYFIVELNIYSIFISDWDAFFLNPIDEFSDLTFEIYIEIPAPCLDISPVSLCVWHIPLIESSYIYYKKQDDS